MEPAARHAVSLFSLVDSLVGKEIASTPAREQMGLWPFWSQKSLAGFWFAWVGFGVSGGVSNH